MKIAYLECFSGMSGDMFLGALVDAGVSASLLEQTVAALDIGARLEISRVKRSGISATKVDVLVHGEKDLPREGFATAQVDGESDGTPVPPLAHSHEHGHSHPYEEAHRPWHTDAHASSQTGAATPHGHDHSHARGLKEIREIIQRAAISDKAKHTAISIFEALGTAEAKIHNSDIESVHFHEVGAVDAMVDIVGAAVGAEALAVDEFVTSPLNVGGGTVRCAHGTLPVPAPATVELLRGAPAYSSGIQAELVTPTGAAIVKVLATRFGTFPEMTIEKSGYGAGTREFQGHANVVRLVVGHRSQVSVQRADANLGHPDAKTECERISVLEANLDDLNPQVFGYVMDRLLGEGALDAFAVPVQMKKNRPGALLTVLCKPENADKLTQLIFTETSTLGVRRRDESRQTLARRWVSVSTQWGDVRIKVASMNGTVTNYAPEYEDCRRIAAEKHVPLKSVMQEATQQYLLHGERH